MSEETFVRWLPAFTALIQLAILPLLLIALDSRIEKAVKSHNDDPYAHPALNNFKKLEAQIDKLDSAIEKLSLAVERLTPRRSTDFPRGDT